MRSLLEVAAVGALIAVTLVAFWFTRSVVQDEMHRQRVAAAQRLSLEIHARLQAGLAEEEGVYGLSNGLPTFSGAQFSSFGRALISGHGFAFVGWAPAVDAGTRRTFERQHGLGITGSGTMPGGGTVVPVLYSVQGESGQPAGIRPGLNLLSSPAVRPALVESAQTQSPSISGNAPVNGAPGVVLLQPMFARDETGERIAGWVVAGIRADRLVAASHAFLPRGAVVRVASGGATLSGPDKAGDREDVVTTSIGQSSWNISVSGVGNGFSLLAPWSVLAIGVALTSLIAILFRQEARLDRARRAELARLAEAALVDSLTGLRNHRAFEEDLARELERQSRSGHALSLVMLDVEDLKTVNDTLGHQEGDERLKSLADALRHAARASDGVYRLGGDEFALVLAENAWGSFQFVQRLQASLAANPADTRVSVAAGVADTIGLETRDVVIRRASLALLEAKRSNRAVIVYSEEFEPVPREPDEESEEQHQTRLATALAQAVDAKDPSTRSHCETVSLLCVMIAEELGLEPKRVAELRLAGLLHDVGKIGIPDAILQKPAKLTNEEFEVMKTHSSLGHSIVKAAGREKEAYWILHHHERPDGQGYPDGLRGDEVPLESRIILVGDAFEAITADRPYRKAASVSEAMAELERHAGTQFDPRCVAALRDAISGGSAVSSERMTAVAVDSD